MIGGVVSKVTGVTGGKFANGAVTGAFAYAMGALARNSAATKSKAPSAKLQKLFASGNAKDRQLAVDEAIKHYGISMKGVKSVTYNGALVEDGITSINGVIEIGPAAFRLSEGWLASTIGHEVEVHFQLQAQQGKWWTDVQGTAIQEVQAYDYELTNAARFGLSASEINLIKTTYRPQYHNQLNATNKAGAAAGNFSTYKP